MKRLIGIAALFLMAFAARPEAAELVMLHQPGCAWCLRFEAEIATAYPRTAQGTLAPLRRVDITRDWPADLAFLPRERFTPSFILVDNGREISRMRGYAGDQFFWFLLDEMLAKLPPDNPAAG